MNEGVRKVMDMTRLDEKIKIFDSEEEAVAACQSSADLKTS
ncbi:MAG: hypothetical protein QGH40_03880 [bacterium]|nr:hypothetical protein [bacterium]